MIDAETFQEIADGIRNKKILVSGVFRKPLKPGCFTWAIIPDGYEFGWLDPPGVLVLYLSERASEEDVDASRALMDEICKEIRGDG